MLHRILLVDDDPEDRFLTGEALDEVMSSRSTLRKVASGNQAIAYMMGEGVYADRKRYPFPTLVIADLNMPDGDGFDVLEFMQANPAWSVVPRIIYSSSDDQDDVRTAYLLGVTAYHQKVLDPSKLKAQMRQILEYWSASEVPPVDETGRLLVTRAAGRRSARYPQPEGGDRMRRPGEVAVDEERVS